MVFAASGRRLFVGMFWRASLTYQAVVMQRRLTGVCLHWVEDGGIESACEVC